VSMWIWVAVYFASLGLVVPALAIFIDRMNHRVALPRSYTRASLLLYMYALELPCVFGTEVGILNVLRDQQRIPAQFPPDVAWWVTLANVTYIVSGVLAFVVAAISDYHHRQ
jgi:hypothetical protein